MLGEAHWLKLPTLARPHSNHLHELFHDGRSTNRKSSGRSKGDTTCPTTSQNPSLWHPSWLNKACTTRKDSESEWLVKDNPETHPITLKPRMWATWQSCSPGFPYLLLSTQAPFPNKISCFVSTCISSDNSFPSVRQEPSFRPWKGSPFLQQVGELNSHVKRLKVSLKYR